MSLWFLSPLQTFQEVEDGEEGDCELPAGEKSPEIKTFSQSSLYRRKSTRGSSFTASVGGKEEKKKTKDDQEKTDEVSGDTTSLCFEWFEHIKFTVRLLC